MTNRTDRASPLHDMFKINGPGFTRRSLMVAAGGSAALLAAGRFADPAAAQDPAELVFQYWGSPQEQDAVKGMTDSFNEQNPDVSVRAQYVANDGYNERMTTALAGGTVPDVAYIDPGMAFDWAANGHTLDLTDYVTNDTETGDLMPNTNYTYNGGRILSTSLALTINCVLYNKTLFGDAGVAAPPTTGETARTWDQFVDTAKQLTKDRDGRNALDPGFDPESIGVYGTTLPCWLPMLWSNNAGVASEDGLTFTMNSPEALDVLQKLQDLIYVHHVSPTPAAAEALPATNVLMQTGKLAMDCNGAFVILDYANNEGLDWGLGVLPKHQVPAVDLAGVPLVISGTTQCPDQAYEFYRWRYSPDRIDLYRRGLWMPIAQDSYTDETKIAAWIDAEEGVYPENARDVFIDYALNNAPYQTPGYWLKNLNQILLEAVTPALDLIWTGEATAQAAMDQAVANATPLMQGVYQPPAQTGAATPTS